MLVIDAATIYPRYSRSGALFCLDIVDGATIKPLIGEDGRAPLAPDPAYQQVLHGAPAADFSADELLYLPRNRRSHRLYGMSPVEQVALTINIALRRDLATETMRLQATQEGLIPLKTWVKSALDQIIQVCMGEPALEFVWVGDDAIDPLQQARTLQILVGAGIKTREEARAELGLGAEKGVAAAGAAAVGKYNHNHDEAGRFSTAENAAGATVRHPARKPRPKGVQVASNNAVMSDVGGTVAQGGPEPPFIEPVRPEPAEASHPTEAQPHRTTPTSSSPARENAAEGVEFGSTGGLRFATDDLLTDHFEDHGSDFGATTGSEYEQQAARFLSDQDTPDILQFERTKGYRQGDLVRFNPKTDEFGVLTPEGQIRTYYRPDPARHGFATNLDYFNYEREKIR